MKILLVSSIFPPDIGGPATYTCLLAKSLTKRHKVSMVTFSPEAAKETGLSIYSLSQGGNSLFRQIRLLRKLISLSGKFDLIYCQDPLVVGMASFLAGKIKRKPVIVKFVGDIIWETARNRGLVNFSLEDFYKKRYHLNRTWRWQTKLQKFILNRVDLIITPCLYLKSFLVKYYQINKKKIQVIPNGIVVQKKTGKKQDIAVTVGRLVNWKGIMEILKTVKEIPGLRYWIVGSGPELKNLKKFIRDFKLKKKVRFFGNLSQAKVKEILSEASIFILNSNYEGLPHVLLEAAGARNALVVPRLPGILEVFSEREVSYFDQTKNDSLKRVLIKLWQNKKKRERIAERAYQKVKEKFFWEKTYKATEKTMKQLIK